MTTGKEEGYPTLRSTVVAVTNRRSLRSGWDGPHPDVGALEDGCRLHPEQVPSHFATQQRVDPSCGRLLAIDSGD